MHPTLLRGLSVIGVAIVVALAVIWLSRSPPDDIIPVEFRGIWLDPGADCQDTSAQMRITGSTINYDRLSFKADGLAERREDTVSLTGESFPNGEAVRETVQLRVQDHRTRLVIVTHDLTRQGSFVRCPSPDKE
ncbi:hypothetical protein [Sphingomonas asaccharolytica]|uniref:hypothetical protein n=1 Tax=Sphingomonas asaccharolytica TaxID=40681 RepID=UPI00083103A0|nr:hypothetical protein [Sphingomonas asaccharolytica]